MKTIEEIIEIILRYAQSNPLFMSPRDIFDPIVPVPAQMPDSQFNRFFSSLHRTLAENAVRTHIRLEELRASDTWADLASIIFGRQTS